MSPLQTHEPDEWWAVIEICDWKSVDSMLQLPEESRSFVPIHLLSIKTFFSIDNRLLPVIATDDTTFGYLSRSCKRWIIVEFWVGLGWIELVWARLGWVALQAHAIQCA